MLDIALKVPLAALDLAGFFERDDARPTRVQVLGEALDGAALASRVAPLKQDDDALVRLFHPRLQLEHLALQRELLTFVVAAQHLVAVRVAGGPPVLGEFVRTAPGLARRLGHAERRAHPRGVIG